MLYTPIDWEADDMLNDPDYLYDSLDDDDDDDDDLGFYISLVPISEYLRWKNSQACELMSELYEQWLADVWPIR